MMASSTLTRLGNLSTAYDRQLSGLSQAYSDASWKLWAALSPSDWWNDGVVYGVAARQAYMGMMMVQQARGYGIANAISVMRLLGGNIPDPPNGGWLPARANTDPQLTAVKNAVAYRHAAVQSPQVKPVEWPKPTEDDYKLVYSWLDAARTRGETVADTDAVRAGDMANRESYRKAGVKLYRRVIHPELSHTGTCGLCVVAADRTYHIKDLNPIHDHCHCTVMPIVNGNDPGLSLNRNDLDTIYSHAGGNKAWQLARVNVTVGEHGEIGPIFDKTGHRQHNDGYVDWTGDTKYVEPDHDMSVQQLETMLTRSRSLLHAMQSVEDTGRAETLDSDGRELNIRPSKSLANAIRYQKAFAVSLRSMLNTSGV